MKNEPLGLVLLFRVHLYKLLPMWVRPSPNTEQLCGRAQAQDLPAAQMCSGARGFPTSSEPGYIGPWLQEQGCTAPWALTTDRGLLRTSPVCLCASTSSHQFLPFPSWARGSVGVGRAGANREIT